MALLSVSGTNQYPRKYLKFFWGGISMGILWTTILDITYSWNRNFTGGRDFTPHTYLLTSERELAKEANMKTSQVQICEPVSFTVNN